MSVTAENETPRPVSGPGFSDAITYAFGDADAGVFGLARLGLAAGQDGTPQASGLALLFDGVQPVAVRAAGGLETAPSAGWDALAAAGVSTTVLEPLGLWDVRFDSDDGRSGFALRFTAVAPAAELPAEHPAAVAGGMQGYEQLCRVTGLARVDGQERAISCLGQRGHTWGAPDWDQIELARTVNAWIGEDLGVSVTGIRGRKAKHHADEALGGTLWAPLGEDDEVVAALLPEVRLSTTSDGEGRQRRATIELFLDEEDPGHRAAGEVLCGTSLDLGRLRLDCSFFLWRMEGRSGVGRYDVLRRVAP